MLKSNKRDVKRIDNKIKKKKLYLERKHLVVNSSHVLYMSRISSFI